MSMSNNHRFTEFMMVSKLKLSQFDGNEDYSIWKQKMRIILVQQKVAKALEGPKTHFDELKTKPAEIEAIILYLFDDIARQVDEAKTIRALRTT